MQLNPVRSSWVLIWVASTDLNAENKLPAEDRSIEQYSSS